MNTMEAYLFCAGCLLPEPYLDHQDRPRESLNKCSLAPFQIQLTCLQHAYQRMNNLVQCEVCVEIQ